ncbi:MAG: hypothetical protein MHM6MM_009200 [Cercozoa sp. M6MM]
MVDLRHLLSEQSEAGEMALWRRLLDECNINLTPGTVSCHCSTPGFFRMCFAAVSDATFDEGMRRLQTFMAAN